MYIFHSSSVPFILPQLKSVRHGGFSGCRAGCSIGACGHPTRNAHAPNCVQVGSLKLVYAVMQCWMHLDMWINDKMVCFSVPNDKAMLKIPLELSGILLTLAFWEYLPLVIDENLNCFDPVTHSTSSKTLSEPVDQILNFLPISLRQVCLYFRLYF